MECQGALIGSNEAPPLIQSTEGRSKMSAPKRRHTATICAICTHPSIQSYTLAAQCSGRCSLCPEATSYLMFGISPQSRKTIVLQLPLHILLPMAIPRASDGCFLVSTTDGTVVGFFLFCPLTYFPSINFLIALTPPSMAPIAHGTKIPKRD